MNFNPRMTRMLLAGGALVAAPSFAFAAQCPEGYPSKPVEFVVAYAAGGGTDAIGRTLASEIEKAQGWTVPVSNKPGAGGDVLMTALKAMEPDGYTVAVSSTNTVALDPYANEGVNFTYEDFDYPGTAMEVTFGLVTLADKPYSTLEEFIEFARENGRATISTSAIALEIAVQKMADHFEVNLVAIPGGGAADALQSALGGHVDATIQGSQHIQQIQAGKMKQLSTLVANRVAYAPDTKTVIESGVDATAGAYVLFALPKGVDPAIRTCLQQVLDEATKSEAYAELMKNFDSVPANLGPDGALDFIKKQAADYKAIFEARNK
ncbi:tripartite tricarboxylate transporter substrate binding protein [Chelativorans sp. AA-79]|uniref:tripartite tricarboxylate transporter substrate binding protein n=1 Tax=Chelativorans sp. AA-79 TaxID=3028735 RepID=UPI0023F8EE1B|nr:tripartite tricarboxylate transporter substrate binding protein [Chelativorans sp. AA-79]WEX08099.1 tripartite tricarboxylate transporter substrate binding protein [Chelativorans sp. AA-79]